MNKLEQAARQALVALEEVMADFDGSWALADKAITALREALAEQAEQERKYGELAGTHNWTPPNYTDEQWQKLDQEYQNHVAEQALQKLSDFHQSIEQEPVAIGTEWKPCMKLPVVVHVREQREGESHVSTREGITPIKPDDLIMRGVAGEEYPIGRELFNKTYTFDTAAPVRTKDLTDGAIWEILETYPTNLIMAIRAVIAADREKNNANNNS